MARPQFQDTVDTSLIQYLPQQKMFQFAVRQLRGDRIKTEIDYHPFFLDCTSPFTVGVHFDALPEASSAIAGNPNRGFCLDYLQIPC